MPLNEDIFTWSKNQAAWQRDALRRIYQHGSLTASDLAEVYSLATDLEAVKAAQSLSRDHFATAGAAGTVRILAMKGLERVNAFPPNREITFAPNGLTVVFGENGAGKSGYARVLKRACRARHSEPIRGNAFEKMSSGKPAVAQIHFEVDGFPKQVSWSDVAVSDEQLSSVVVYDSRCAGDYIESEGQPIFQPFGLRALNELGRACKFIEEKLSSEIEKLPLDKRPFGGLVGDTSVGRYIAALGKSSSLKELLKLGVLSDVEHDRFRELGKVLSDSDPEPKAKSLERLANRLAEIATKIQRADLYTSTQAIDKFRKMLDDVRESSVAQDTAKSTIAGERHLIGTGGDRWAVLIQAARVYSEGDAYPEKSFPNVEQDARCVLCQDKLRDDGRSNLRAYSEYSVSDARKNASAAVENLKTAKTKIESASAEVGVDETICAELSDQGSDLVSRLEKWKRAWEARRRTMLGAVVSNDLNALLEVPSDAATDADMRRLAGSLNLRAIELRNAANPTVRAVLLQEYSELTSRTALSPHLPAVESYIRNAIRVGELTKIKTQCSSLAISRRVSELANIYLTDDLLSGMQEELKEIGYSRSTKHKIPRRAAKGVMLCRVELDGSTAPTADVLSEGEQRATAFAFFLSEAHVSEKRSTLVFDDPVTSLDHRYRRKIANRLASIARERQVIVFTHDAVFLTSLHRAADAVGCAIAARHVEWDAGPGLAKEGLGWDVMGTSERIDQLKRSQAKLKGEWGEYPSEANKREMAHVYDQLRGTMERIIRENLLNDVIAPFSDEIKVESFEAVIGVDLKQWERFIEVYDRACESMRGHDTSAEAQAVLPTPEQLGSDLAVLDEVVREAKSRKKLASEKQSERRKTRRRGLEELSRGK
jgi:energy-coupling factor transporter ATP-binding protein EcfA2